MERTIIYVVKLDFFALSSCMLVPLKMFQPSHIEDIIQYKFLSH